MRSLYAASDFVVLAAWIVLGGALIVRHRTVHRPAVRRNPSWRAGLVLQTVAMCLLFVVSRPLFDPFSGMGQPAEVALALTAIGLAVASLWFMIAAQRALGLQFAYQARLVEGHRLVREGPYSVVRHPIYTGLFGLSLASGLALSRWWMLPVFTVLYAAGTLMRIRAEESLLREAFGEQFDEYRRQVPAFLPGLF